MEDIPMNQGVALVALLACAGLCHSDDPAGHKVSSVTIVAQWVDEETIAVSVEDIEFFAVAFLDLTLMYDPEVINHAGWRIHGEPFGYWRETPAQSTAPGEIRLEFGIDRATQQAVDEDSICILIHFGWTGNPGFDDVWWGQGSAVYDLYANEPMRLSCVGSAPQD